jgi:NADH-quinone oxidoreductase subunit C
VSAAAALAALVEGATADTEFGDPVVTLPADRWVQAATACRDQLGLTYLDMLTAVDDGETLAVVAYLWNPAGACGLLLRTHVPAAAPTLASITPVFAGANWHERETAEMFGLTFAGHPNPRPLLLADPPPAAGFHPLRKELALARREQVAWSGEVDPQ